MISEYSEPNEGMLVVMGLNINSAIDAVYRLLQKDTNNLDLLLYMWEKHEWQRKVKYSVPQTTGPSDCD